MNCPECGKILPQEAAFCFICGAAVAKGNDKSVISESAVPEENTEACVPDVAAEACADDNAVLPSVVENSATETDESVLEFVSSAPETDESAAAAAKSAADDPAGVEEPALDNDAPAVPSEGHSEAPDSAAVESVFVQPPVIRNRRASAPDPGRDISVWGYIGAFVLSAIPVVGFICMLIWACAAKNINRRHFGAAMLVIMIIAACAGAALMCIYADALAGAAADLLL